MMILDLLLEKRTPLSLKEISEFSGFPKSTVHATLSTLREYRMVEQEDDGRYALGIHLYELGCAAASTWDISGMVHPYLEKLSEVTGASSFIAVLDKDGGMTFDHSSGAGGLQIVSDLGTRLPLHATAQGKILLSGMEEAELDRYLEGNYLAEFTPHTITDVRKLREEIEKVRRDGYAVEDGEYRIGLRACACGVKDQKGRIRYAMGTLGFFRRVNSEEFQDAIRETMRYAGLLSREVARKMV